MEAGLRHPKQCKNGGRLGTTGYADGTDCAGQWTTKTITIAGYFAAETPQC